MTTHRAWRKWARIAAHCLMYIALLFVFRAVAFTVYTIDGQGLDPVFAEGDRVLVNRWSYGLRIGSDNSIFGYGRLCSQPVRKGDIVAFNDPRKNHRSQVLICRCKAVPGDTVQVNGQTMVVPGKKDCADADYYWMEAIGNGNPTDSRQLGFVSEKYIIGRVCSIIYSHDPKQSVFKGWRKRWMKAL